MGSQGKFTDSLRKYVSTTRTSRDVRMRITTIVIYFAGHKFHVTPGPVAKNVTPRPSSWESNPRPLDY